ncbi:hypothetical protein MVEG_11182 [Podila verticillata NRRL 6337]|uniref:JmjC domain-containing protein n=1 Tax=Podila verticillata NRRL 6337 TaxID=1069443 RepID=A0A086TMG8_9FUNG|nr:MAG: hypothetical protein BYD32DRAFT_411364 [Podila humilis]KFH63145.1 hypothetical protein MVEG_11182 [Podila verticillata NRRL 6337]
MVALSASAPAQVRGLLTPEDRFPRRYRNQLPLAIRQIIAPSVLEQWSSNPQHVIESLIQSVKEQQQKEHQQDQEGCGRDIEQEHGEDNKETLLPVMVAEDSKNFMDNPQFTKKIHMSAYEIVQRVIMRPREAAVECGIKNNNKNSNNDCSKGEQIVAQTAASPSLSAASICPLCNNGAESALAHTHPTRDLHLARFYYRGVVPSSLYTDLAIPALLDSLALPKTNSTFANAPNRDLMRIWISLAGATTPLHYDRCHGILIQLVGRKRFVVFSHEDTHGLYPYDGISGPGHASKVRGLGHCFPFKLPLSSDSASSSSSYLQQPDQHNLENLAEAMDRWPRVGKTCPWVVDLEPGDALYTPPGFWHEVTSVDHSISITVPWDMDANELEEVPRHMAF